MHGNTTSGNMKCSHNKANFTEHLLCATCWALGITLVRKTQIPVLVELAVWMEKQAINNIQEHTNF